MNSVGVIDQDALIEALENKTIWAAALDVMTPEPLPSDHPLTKLPNCGKFILCGPLFICNF